MLKLTVGSPFPSPVHPGDHLTPVIDGASLTLIVGVTSPQPNEIRAINTGALRYGVLAVEAIPIIILEVAGFGSLDAGINIHVEPQAKRDAFLAADEPAANLVQIYLVDTANGILRGIRVLGTAPEFVPAVKAACFDQLAAWPDASSVRAAISRIQVQYSTAQMMDRATMHRSQK